MVAYSFKRMFAPKIRAGTKRHTMRNERKRHARIGEEVQLYTGMRTNRCELIGKATCSDVQPVRIDFRDAIVEVGGQRVITGRKALDAFAQSDGFDDWRALCAFWEAEHSAPSRWSGVIIYWGDLR